MLRRMTGKGMSTKGLVGGKKGGAGRQGSITDVELENAYGLGDLPDEQAKRVKHLIKLLSAIRQCNKAKTLDDGACAFCAYLH
jgi:hypothetical protein